MTIVFIFIFGLAIGSFLNVCIDRLANEQSLNGRSHCDYCNKKLGPIDLIPVVSYVFLGGKCRYCHKKLSLFYPFVEVLTGICFVLVLTHAYVVIKDTYFLQSFFSFVPIRDVGGLFLIGLVFMAVIRIALLGIVSSLIVIFFADYKYHIIPDEATIALIIFSLPIVWFNNPGAQTIFAHIIGGIVLFAILSLIYHGSIFFLKKEGMGYGDVKLAFAMGFLLGPKPGGLALYLSFLIGGVVGTLLLLLGKKARKSMIAFGPFMVLGIVLMLFFDEYVIRMVQVFVPYL